MSWCRRNNRSALSTFRRCGCKAPAPRLTCGCTGTATTILVEERNRSAAFGTGAVRHLVDRNRCPLSRSGSVRMPIGRPNIRSRSTRPWLSAARRCTRFIVPGVTARADAILPGPGSDRSSPSPNRTELCRLDHYTHQPLTAEQGNLHGAYPEEPASHTSARPTATKTSPLDRRMAAVALSTQRLGPDCARSPLNRRKTD